MTGTAVGGTSREPHPPRENTAGTIDAVSRGILTLVVASILLGWLAIASVHARDRFMVGWGEGAQLSLAASAKQGVLYPPLFDGVSFGGSRLMPLPILLDAGSETLIGDQILASKLVTYLAFLLLLAVIYRTLRSFGCSNITTLGLLAILVASRTGMTDSLRISPDALPVALQLLALKLAADRRSQNLAVAALLCAVAFFSKSSALWAASAIFTWLLFRERRAAWRFASVLALSVAALAGLFQLLSGGRFTENVVDLAFAGERGGIEFRRAGLSLLLLFGIEPALLLLAGIVAPRFVRAVRELHPTLYDVALGFALLLLAVVLTDRGTELNHFLDVFVLIIVLAGDAIARGTAGREVVPGLSLARLVLLVALTSTVAVGLGPESVQAVGSITTGPDPAYARRPLTELIAPSDRVLSEDPTVPLELGMNPVVMDPFMLLSLAADHPAWVANLVDRIRRHEFDLIVLVKDPDHAPSYWYSELHFGPAVIGAIRRNYHLFAKADGYFVYRPDTESTTGANQVLADALIDPVRGWDPWHVDDRRLLRDRLEGGVE